METPTLNGKAAVYSDPPSVTFGKDKKCQWLWFLWFYAGTVSAALIVLAIVGSIHLNEVKRYHDCKDVSSPENMTTGKWQAVQLPSVNSFFSSSATSALGVAVNVALNREMIKGENGTHTILDFNKHQMTVFDKDLDKCYVSKQVDGDTADVTELLKILENSPSSINLTEETVMYDVDDMSQDQSELPAEVAWMCQGRDVYTMTRVQTDTTGKGKSGSVVAKGCIIKVIVKGTFCCGWKWFLRCVKRCELRVKVCI